MALIELMIVKPIVAGSQCGSNASGNIATPTPSVVHVRMDGVP
jgi:hypothetical protein